MENAFKFNLQKVLDIRKDKEDESIRNFKNSQNEKLEIENKIINLKDSYEKYRGIKPNENIIYQKIKRSYLNSLTGAIKDKEVELQYKEIEVEEKRKDLNEKRLEKRTVEILKEKQYDKFIKEQNRVERVTNDELALYAFMRNKKD